MGGQRERETDRQTETETETDRQTESDRQTDRQTECDCVLCNFVTSAPFHAAGNTDDAFTLTPPCRIQTSRPLDHETQVLYDLEIRVTDLDPTDPKTDTQVYTVKIADVNDNTPVSKAFRDGRFRECILSLLLY